MWLSALSLLRFPINLRGADKVEGSALNGSGFLRPGLPAPEGLGAALSIKAAATHCGNDGRGFIKKLVKSPR